MSQSKATPRPWKIESSVYIKGAQGERIAEVSEQGPRYCDPVDANAELIVRAVNCHDELVNELIRCRAAVKNAVESLKHLGCKAESTEYYLNEASKSNELIKHAKGEA